MPPNATSVVYKKIQTKRMSQSRTNCTMITQLNENTIESFSTKTVRNLQKKKMWCMWTSPAEKRGEKKAAGFCRNERQRALPGSASTLSASTISQSRSFGRPSGFQCQAWILHRPSPVNFQLYRRDTSETLVV